MKRAIIILACLLVGGSAFGQTNTPTETNTPTATPTATPSVTPTRLVMTNFGTDQTQGAVRIKATEHDRPGVLVFETVTSGGTKVEYFLWVDSTGDLRISAQPPGDQDSNGSVVGGQS